MSITHHLNRNLIGSVLVAAALFDTSIASARNWLCADETLSPGTYGNVRVAAGASCTIPSGVIITGNLSATNAASLAIRGTDLGKIADCESATVKILGNVTVIGLDGASSTDDVTVYDACIEGNLTVKDSSALGQSSEGITVLRSTINGNATIRNNNAVQIRFGSSELGGADVGGNVTVKGNSVDIYLVVNNGFIGGNLTVKSNFAVEEIAIFDRTIAGNLIVTDNVSTDDIFPQFVNRIARNHIDGNLKFIGNTAIDSVQIDTNTVDGNLTCKKNNPDPSIVDNTVSGKSNCSD